MSEVYNLDESVQEYFEFKLKGHNYRFNHMNTEQIEELQKLKGDDKKSQEFMFKFISKVDEKSPDFTELSKQMIAPHWIKFTEMIKAEFGG